MHRAAEHCREARAIGNPRQDGVVLIALLWVLVAVSLLALNLASVVRSETAVAQASGEADQCYFYARGVLEVALYRLSYADRDPEKRRHLFPYSDGMHHFWMSRDEMLGHVAIFDEAGKMDLNAAQPEYLLRLFEILAVPEEQKAALMDAIEMRRPTAAPATGDDAQPRPGPFVSVEEILQIRGVSRATLYGTHRQEGEKTVYRRGLIDFLTVHSGSRRININSAELEVLASLPGIDLATASSLIQARHDKPFEAVDLATRTSGVLSGEALSLIAADFSGVYCLVATSGVKHSSVRRSIKAIASLDSRGLLGHHRLAWYDEYWPPRRVIQRLESQPNSLAAPQMAMLTPALNLGIR